MTDGDPLDDLKPNPDEHAGQAADPDHTLDVDRFADEDTPDTEDGIDDQEGDA